MSNETLRLGTRGSVLARTQSGIVADAITEATGLAVELVIIKTTGDRVTDRPLQQVGGKGLFTKEIEDALLAGEVDFAVHSMKDMPTDNPPGLVIACVPERVDPRDALVGAALDALPEGAVVGTGSVRRALQLRELRPDLEIKGIRGNVDTRIQKQRDGEYDVDRRPREGDRQLGLGVVGHPLECRDAANRPQCDVPRTDPEASGREGMTKLVQDHDPEDEPDEDEPIDRSSETTAGGIPRPSDPCQKQQERRMDSQIDARQSPKTP